VKRLVDAALLTGAFTLGALVLVTVAVAIVLALACVFVCFQHAVNFLEVAWPN
jgi:hypothetical protein